jgi:hypothetical protein
MLRKIIHGGEFLPPQDLSIETARAVDLLRTQLNMTLSTTGRFGRPRGTVLTAIFRPVEGGIAAQWYSERGAQHSANIRRPRWGAPWLTGWVALTLYDSTQRHGALNLTGRAGVVPLADLPPAAAEAILNEHNSRRQAKDPTLKARTLDEFTRADNPMELWEVPIDTATMPATLTSIDGRTRASQIQLPLHVLAQFEQPDELSDLPI